MMSALAEKTVWLYREPIDFRKQMNGLIGLVVSEMKINPIDGSLYVFRNQQRNKIKLLMWDRNGFFLGYKRLERGKFDFPSDAEEVRISWDELLPLIAGMPMVRVGKQAKAETVYA